MTENATFKVKTADECKAEFDTYQKKFDDEYKARAHEIAKTFKNFMYLFPKQTEWWPEIPADCNDNIKSHLKTLFKNAGFVIEFGRTHAIIKMTENATFKVKTADERKAEFDAYNVTQNKLEEEYRAKAYTIARDIEAFMDKNPNVTQWLYSIYKGHEPKAISYVQNPKVVFHLESLYKKAGFNISTVFEEELGLCLIKISRK